MEKTNWRNYSLPMILCALFIILIIIQAFVLLYGPKEPASASDVAIQRALNPDLDYQIIVNDSHPYEFDGDYDTALKASLVCLPDIYGNITLLEKATSVAFLELQKALNDKGMMIGLYSGYRTFEGQQSAYASYANRKDWSETNKVAAPGYSEHHTGLLLNILIWYQGENDEYPIWYTETAERQATIPEFQLLHQTLADYGFIDRYPSGKEEITGIPCEPYEIRFVGSAKIAHEIMDKNLALEEWITK